MTLIFNNPVRRYCSNSTNRYGITFEYDTIDQIYVRDLDDNNITDWIIEGTDLRFTTGTPPAEFEIYRFTDLSTSSYGTPQFSQFSSGSAISSAELNSNLEIFRTIVDDWRSSGSSSVDVSNSYGLSNFVINQPSVNVTADNLNSTLELFRRAVLYINDLQSGVTPTEEVDISRSYGATKFSLFSQSSPITAENLNGNFEFIRAAIEETVGTLIDRNPDIAKTALSVYFGDYAYSPDGRPTYSGYDQNMYDAVALLVQHLPPYWDTPVIPGAETVYEYLNTNFYSKVRLALGYLRTFNDRVFENLGDPKPGNIVFNGTRYPFAGQVSMVFRDTEMPAYVDPFITLPASRKYYYTEDMEELNDNMRLMGGDHTVETGWDPLDYFFGPNYFHGVVFQTHSQYQGVDPVADWWTAYISLLQAGEANTPPYNGIYGTADYDNLDIVYDISQTQTALYYANLIISTFNSKTGFNIPLIT